MTYPYHSVEPRPDAPHDGAPGIPPTERTMTSQRPDGADRRRHPRVPLDWPVTIRLPDGNHEARIRDVSRAGLCFFIDRSIPEMTVLALDLDLPPNEAGEAEHVRGSGVVVRCQPLSPRIDHYEVAVLLNDMAESDQDRLSAYVAGAG